jgi:hypothetical protein
MCHISSRRTQFFSVSAASEHQLGRNWRPLIAVAYLTSPRLGFRCWSEDDLPLATELWCEPKVSAFIGDPLTPELAQARLAKEIAQMRVYGVEYWPIFCWKTIDPSRCWRAQDAD